MIVLVAFLVFAPLNPGKCLRAKLWEWEGMPILARVMILIHEVHESEREHTAPHEPRSHGGTQLVLSLMARSRGPLSRGRRALSPASLHLG